MKNLGKTAEISNPCRLIPTSTLASNMRPSNSLSRVKLLLILLIAFPFSLSAAPAQSESEINLEILAQRDQLVPYMTQAQRISLLKLEATLESAESDFRTGQHLADTKPSSMDPDRNIQPTITRGEKLMESSQKVIEDTQIALAKLLSEADANRVEQQALSEQKYDYVLTTATLDEALAQEIKPLMEACWDQGYTTLFYNKVFLQDATGTRSAKEELKSKIYDLLAEADGTRFSLTVPIDFKLKTDSDGSAPAIFSFENEGIFESDKKALIIPELILPDASSTGLLALKALDFSDRRIIAHALVKVSDLAEQLELGSPDDQDKTPTHFELRGHGQTIDALSGLATPYVFELISTETTTVANEALTKTLLMNSGIILTDSEFIKRAYGEALEAPESWKGTSTARLAVVRSGDNTFDLTAKANTSSRTLPAGTMRLTQGAEAE